MLTSCSIYYRALGICLTNGVENVSVTNNICVKLNATGGSTIGPYGMLFNYQYTTTYGSTWDDYYMKNITISNNKFIDKYSANKWVYAIAPTFAVNAVNLFYIEDIVVDNNIFDGNVFLTSTNHAATSIVDMVFTGNRVLGDYRVSLNSTLLDIIVSGGSVDNAVNITLGNGFNFNNILFKDDVTIDAAVTNSTVVGCVFQTGKTLTVAGATNYVSSNTLDGVIANPIFSGNITIGAAEVSEAELEILDGATVTTTELNYVSGVTSAIQTQINTKSPIADPTFTGEIGIGAVNVSETELGILEGATVTTTELNVLDGIPGTLTFTELGYVDGVTSSIQTQIDNVAVKTIKKTIGTPGDTGVDFTWTGDADALAQNLDLGAIVPAKARVNAIEIVCTETVTSSAGAVDITMRAGNVSTGPQFILDLSCDDINEVVGIINAALPATIIMNWAAATNIWIGGDPDQNWDTLTAGQWSVYITYVQYS